MSLKIILGKKSKNKSEYIYNMIYQDVNKNKNVLLFVPSQKRVVEENEYMDFLNLDGIINLKITTLSEYIKKILKILNMHIEDRYLTKVDKRLIVIKILNENKNLLKRYSKVANTYGFIDEIVEYIDIFRGFNVKNEKDIEAIKSIKIENKIAKEKLLEILFIYEKYLEYISNNSFLDDTNYINLYNDTVDLKNMPQVIYFDGYNNFKKVELNIIEMYLKNNVNIVINLTTDAKCIEDVESSNTSEIFEVSNYTYLELIRIAAKYGSSVYEEYVEYVHNKPYDLQKLATYTFLDDVKWDKKSENITINLVKNEKSEIISIAEKLLSSLKEDSFSDSVIFTTDIEKYENIIKQVFFEYKIPFYIDKKVRMKQNLLIKYILNFLDILLDNKNNSLNIIKTLKYGLNDIDDKDIYILENYIIEFNVYNFKNEFIYNFKSKYDLEALNALRCKILSIYNIEFENEDVNYYINKIYTHLIDNNIFENYKNYISSITNEDEKKVLIEAVSKFNEVLDSISKIYSNSKMSFKDFSNMLKSTISKIELNKIPLSGNEVLILDINSSKSTYKKNVFIIGANEEEFPKTPNEDIIFNDLELEEFSEKGFKLKENVNSKINMALYNIYEVFTLPENKMYFYYKSSDMRSKTLNKSHILESLESIFGIEVYGSVSEEENLNILNYENLLCSMRDTLDPVTKVAIFNYLKKEEDIKNVLKWEKNDENLNSKTLEFLYGDKITSSVTKLESFKKCPFSYYLKYIVNIDKREEFDVTSLDLGTLMHGVVEDFSYYILKNNITFKECNDEEVFKKLEPEIENIINNRIDSIIVKQKQSVKYTVLKHKLVSTLKSILKVIAKSFAQSEFTPFLYEAEFKENSTFTPIVLNFENGKKIELIGKIDRIDTLKLDNKMYVRVVDYKSSNRDLTLNNIKDGTSIQLLTYLDAFKKNIKSENSDLEVVPAAMNYFTLSDNMLSLDENMTDEEIKEKVIKKLRLKGIFLKDAEILNKMDNCFESSDRLIDVSKRSLSMNSSKLLEKDEYIKLLDSAEQILKDIANEILSGVVKIKPNKKSDACKYCNYASICRKNIRV